MGIKDVEVKLGTGSERVSAKKGWMNMNKAIRKKKRRLVVFLFSRCLLYFHSHRCIAGTKLAAAVSSFQLHRSPIMFDPAASTTWHAAQRPQWRCWVATCVHTWSPVYSACTAFCAWNTTGDPYRKKFVIYCISTKRRAARMCGKC